MKRFTLERILKSPEAEREAARALRAGETSKATSPIVREASKLKQS